LLILIIMLLLIVVLPLVPGGPPLGFEMFDGRLTYAGISVGADYTGEGPTGIDLPPILPPGGTE
jgi:hypothetical protein